MSPLPALLLCAALAGAASATVTVDGTAVAAGASGEGWTFEEPVVRLTGPGPFVVSGADLAGGTVLRAEADCAVVASNLALSAASTGLRPRADGWDRAYAVATDGAGRSVAVFPEGIFRSSVPTAALPPDDPAASDASWTFTWGDAWEPSNVAWEPNETNDAAVAWTGERFVAARFRGGFMVSEDGAEWRAAVWNGTPYNLRAVARDPASGTLVAASTQGIWKSADGGLSWTQATNFCAYAVVWKDGLFVASGGDNPAQDVFWSADGSTWLARRFPDGSGSLSLLVAGGGGRFLAGNANGWRALSFADGTLSNAVSGAFSGSRFAVAAGNGIYVACAIADTGLRFSTNGVDWTRSDKRDGTFPSIVFRGGKFFAEGVDGSGSYAGLWTSADGAAWTRVEDGWSKGLPALDCGAHDVRLVVAGSDNALVGGLYAPAVRVAPGGSLDVSARDAASAVLGVRGGRWAAAAGGCIDEDAGAFVQRSATIFAEGGCYAPDVGPGAYGAADGGTTVLGGSLRPSNGFFSPPSNGVEAVRCVVVDGLAPGEAVHLANLPADYGTDGVVADADGCVYLWLPAAAEPFRFIADGALRRVPAGGGTVPAETLPDPKVEEATFAVPTNGVMEVTLRVSSPVEAAALAPAYATDLAALAAGGRKLDPTNVEQVAEDEYELTFRLPSSDDSGFLVIQAK